MSSHTHCFTERLRRSFTDLSKRAGIEVLHPGGKRHRGDNTGYHSDDDAAARGAYGVGGMLIMMSDPTLCRLEA